MFLGKRPKDRQQSSRSDTPQRTAGYLTLENRRENKFPFDLYSDVPYELKNILLLQCLPNNPIKFSIF